MKKKKVTVFVITMFLLLLLSCSVSAATPVGSHGRLKVKGAKLVDAKGKTFQIKGVSTHGLAWYPEYVSKNAFKDLRDKWGVNTVRLAMYTAEYHGYCVSGSSNQKTLKKKIDAGVKAATDLGMYVIIDWHTLSDSNPNTYKKQSLAFFKEMAKKYKNHKNVIYEICNEPNGGTSWKQVKSYAQAVIREIRAIDKNAVILVGTPTWSQDVDTAAKDPIKGYGNIMYTLHFYANTHQSSYRTKAEKAIKAGLPLLVSEFGICNASGNGGVNEKEANKWISFLNKYSIGYVAWNLSNKNESAALIKSSCSKKSGWTYSDLSQSGKWLVRTNKGSLAKASSAKTTAKKSTSSSKSAPKSSTSSSKAGNCKVTVQTVNSWKSGNRYFTHYTVTIKNPSKKAVNGWKITLGFKNSISKSSDWNGYFTYKGKYITIKPVSWNKKIPAKGISKDIGFIVSTTAKTNPIKSIKIQ